jgi:hypothetical protein
MASVVTGVVPHQVLPLDDGVSAIRVRAPGVAIRFETVAMPPSLSAEDAAPGEGVWDEAITSNDLSPAFQPITAEPVPVPFGAAPLAAATLSVPGSRDPHAELEATPDPGDGLVLMVRNGDVVQWFVPVNADAALAAAPVDGLQGLEAPPPAPLRFLVPQSALTSMVGASPAGFSASAFGKTVLHFFRFSLVQELLDGVVEHVVAWIAGEVEAKTKTERLLSFDPDHGFPPIQAADLKPGRTLLLTHGIFSSVTGAFAGFGTANDPLLAYLRGKYANIVGWDHHTVSKAPLDNARDLLTALPDGIDVDVLCHSRGALVTRAMFEDQSLQALVNQKIHSVGTAIFVAGANQGSQLARYENLNRLLNIYSAIGSIPILGGAGVLLKVIVGVVKALAHGALKIPSIIALNPDPAVNAFLAGLNGPTMTTIGQLVVVHANYDPTQGLLKEYVDWNVDLIFGAANDLVVPFSGAEVFDAWLPVADVNNYRFGPGGSSQPTILHTNFFYQENVHDIIRTHL